MRMLVVLFATCLAVAAATWAVPGPLSVGVFAGALVGAAMTGLIGLYFILREPPAQLPEVVVDGSNVMFWVDGKPNLKTVRTVVKSLQDEGFSPIVWFDANAGYLVEDRYMPPQQLALQIGLPTRAVRVAPKGTPADPLILAEARDRRARIVTNDRFRDLQDDFPEVSLGGHLVTGRIDTRGAHLRLH